MLRSAIPTDDLRRRRVLVLAVAAGLLVVAAITYTALSRGHTQSNPAQQTPRSAATAAGPTSAPAPTNGVLPDLASTADPEEFARVVAHAIFDWDTTVLVPRSAYLDRIASVADPTGESSPGLISDVDAYLPPESTWIDLREYETRQWIEIDTSTVPTQWDTALDQAGDQLAPGTIAYTITGTRHRAGIWDGDAVTSQHEVAFTAFMVCAPTYDDCRLLRLSLLDEPLE